MKILAIGPYIGDFKEEVFTFRPYARWLSKAVQWDNIYLSTHINRIFLYDFVPEENIIPVYNHLSRDEKNQNGYVHKTLNKKDFNLVLRKYKDEIIEKENCNKNEIEIHHLSYTKNTPPYSIYNKIFEEIPKPEIEIPEEHKNKILFIPSREEKIEKISFVYQHAKMCYDILVVGNTDTWFSEENVILSKIDYFESGWKYIIRYIMESKAIICPLGYWTGIANLQNKPVFSWGENVSTYKEGGIYNFRNRKSYIVPSNSDTDPRIIIKSMENFINEI